VAAATVRGALLCALLAGALLMASFLRRFVEVRRQALGEVLATRRGRVGFAIVALVAVTSYTLLLPLHLSEH